MSEQRLLILDDEILTARTIRAIAEFAGFTVALATRPGEFFEQLERWRPDVIALDLVMPEMDGVEVMTELARRGCRSRIIITSGVGSRVLDAAGRSAGEHGLNISGILAKPFTPSSLRALLAPDRQAASRAGQAWQQWGNAVEAGEDKGQGAGLDDEDQAPPGEITLPSLQRAIRQDELFVCYQPKVTCQTGVVTGFEALVRWRHPRLGVVAPAHFISLAEQGGLIDDLTIEVLTQSLHWLSAISHRDQPVRNRSQRPEIAPLTLSINLSAASLNNMAIFERVNELCEDLDIDPRRLVFELTETSAMEDPVTSLDLLTRLRMKGFRLSIDDFGTGFSSMLQLVRLPFSEIKVDKSFVVTARESAESRAVIKSIVELGHSLGLQVTAEGIENEESLNYLRNVGCDLAQGFCIARPMRGERVASWLEQRQPNHEQRRMAALRALNLLDTEKEARYDRLTELSRRLFDLPMAAISLVDADRVWLKSRQGLQIQELPRFNSFCTYTVDSDEVNVIPDVSEDDRFHRLAMVMNAPMLRFYAGAPLHAVDGSRIGALCVLDRRPRAFNETQMDALRELAKLVEQELYAHSANVLDLNTGAFHSREFDARAGGALAVCSRLRLPSTLLLIQLQNPGGGGQREAGQDDRKLARTASLLQGVLRESDLLGRFDQDKLLALLPGTGEEEGKAALARLQRDVLKHEHDSPLGQALHCKVGSAVLTPGSGHGPNSANSDLQSLLTRAELAIYEPERG